MKSIVLQRSGDPDESEIRQVLLFGWKNMDVFGKPGGYDGGGAFDLAVYHEVQGRWR